MKYVVDGAVRVAVHDRRQKSGSQVAIVEADVADVAKQFGSRRSTSYFPVNGSPQSASDRRWTVSETHRKCAGGPASEE